MTGQVRTPGRMMGLPVIARSITMPAELVDAIEPVEPHGALRQRMTDGETAFGMRVAILPPSTVSTSRVVSRRSASEAKRTNAGLPIVVVRHMYTWPETLFFKPVTPGRDLHPEVVPRPCDQRAETNPAGGALRAPSLQGRLRERKEPGGDRLLQPVDPRRHPTGRRGAGGRRPRWSSGRSG